MTEPAYLSNKAIAVKEVSFPSFYASYVNEYLFQADAAILKDEDHDNELFDDLADSGANQRSYPHAINSYGFTQHESPELQASLKLKGRPEDWTILLKVGSTGDFMWGDSGDLFFVIHKSDLAKGDFSNVFVTLESS